MPEIELTTDPNKAVSLCKRKVEGMKVDVEERSKELVWNLSMPDDPEAEIRHPEKKGNSWSLIDCVHYLVKKHGKDQQEVVWAENYQGKQASSE